MEHIGARCHRCLYTLPRNLGWVECLGSAAARVGCLLLLPAACVEQTCLEWSAWNLGFWVICLPGYGLPRLPEPSWVSYRLDIWLYITYMDYV